MRQCQIRALFSPEWRKKYDLSIFSWVLQLQIKGELEKIDKERIYSSIFKNICFGASKLYLSESCLEDAKAG